MRGQDITAKLKSNIKRRKEAKNPLTAASYNALNMTISHF